MSDESETRWQAQVKSLKEGIHEIYKNKEFSDVIFTIKGEYQFRVHRLVLSARSPVFARMLLNTYIPEEIIIEEDSITATGFEMLLRYIYTNKIGTSDRKAIIETYLAADHYQQKSLKLECEKQMNSWSITENDVCKMLDAGLCINALRDRCLAFIRDNTKDVLFSPSFLDISFACLSTILESGVLQEVEVLQRINRIMEWAAKCYTLTKEKADYSCVREDFLRSEPPLLNKLNLEMLKLNDLAVVVKKYKGLLTSSEVMQFMEYSSDKDESVLPDWYGFSTIE